MGVSGWFPPWRIIETKRFPYVFNRELIKSMTTNNQTQLSRRVAGVEQHYQKYAPHPGRDESSDWIQSLPITQAILRWVGKGQRVLDLGCHKGDITILI